MTITLTNSIPASGAVNVSLTDPLSFTLHTDNGPFDPNTINISFKFPTSANPLHAVIASTVQPGFVGAPFQIPYSITPIGPGEEEIDFSIQSIGPFNSFEEIEVTVTITDNGLIPVSFVITFRTEDVNAPVITNVTPTHMSVNNATNTPIYFRIEDQGSGVDLSTLNVILNVTTDAGITNVGQILGGVIASGFDPNLTSIQLIGNSVDVYLQVLPNILWGNQPFPSGGEVSLEISVSDESDVVNQSYSFDMIEVEPRVICHIFPALY